MSLTLQDAVTVRCKTQRTGAMRRAINMCKEKDYFARLWN